MMHLVIYVGRMVQKKSDPFIQEAYTSTPLLGMAASTLIASDEILKSLEDVNVPFFILVGENDTRVNILDSEALIQSAKSQDKQMEIIDNARHLLFQDTPEITKDVIEKVIDWILTRTK